MKFTLEIELGNDAMQTYRDITFALVDLIGRLPSVDPDDDDDGRIYDHNGNKVGTWQVSEN